VQLMRHKGNAQAALSGNPRLGRDRDDASGAPVAVVDGPVVATKIMLATGGFDVVLVRLVPPVLLAVKLIERAVPEGTSP